VRVSITAYDVNRPFIQKWFSEQTSFGGPEGAAIMSAALHVPVIVCNFYIGEVSGWKQDTLDTIESLTKFYKYSEIEGIPDGYPGRRL